MVCGEVGNRGHGSSFPEIGAARTAVPVEVHRRSARSERRLVEEGAELFFDPAGVSGRRGGAVALPPAAAVEGHAGAAGVSGAGPFGVQASGTPGPVGGFGRLAVAGGAGIWISVLLALPGSAL